MNILFKKNIKFFLKNVDNYKTICYTSSSVEATPQKNKNARVAQRWSTSLPRRGSRVRSPSRALRKKETVSQDTVSFFRVLLYFFVKKGYTNLIFLRRGDDMSRISIKVKGIVECQGKYLLVQKWYDDNIINPYKWEFVDCELEPGKGPDETVIENIENGMGLGVSISKILYTWTYTVGDTFYVGIAYLCKAEGDVVIMSDDYSDSVWVGPEEFGDYIEDQRLLGDLKKYILDTPDDNEDLELEI